MRLLTIPGLFGSAVLFAQILLGTSIQASVSNDLPLVHREETRCDSRGNVVEETLYDADGQLIGRLYRTYSEQGDLLAETKLLGQTTVYYWYDPYGRCTVITNFSEQGSSMETHLFYDSHGNVVEEALYNANGQLIGRLYRTYSEQGDLLTETNLLGQTAAYYQCDP